MIKLAFLLFAAAWTNPVEVHHDDQVAVSYQARLDGPYLVVRANLQPGCRFARTTRYGPSRRAW